MLIKVQKKTKTHIGFYVNVWILEKASDNAHESKKNRKIIQTSSNLRLAFDKINNWKIG